jgi:hypothetical protein
MLTDRPTRQFVKSTVDYPLNCFGLHSGAVFNGCCFVDTFVLAYSSPLTFEKISRTDNRLTGPITYQDKQ